MEFDLFYVFMMLLVVLWFCNVVVVICFRRCWSCLFKLLRFVYLNGLGWVRRRFMLCIDFDCFYGIFNLFILCMFEGECCYGLVIFCVIEVVVDLGLCIEEGVFYLVFYCFERDGLICGLWGFLESKWCVKFYEFMVVGCKCCG